ncbi:uncharacterized protein K489DRAFT_109686 [Dissoconium aciculare CBS 342.82]|uniref:F-box domain-containing protein n=1 Tax=Dissoconium aciculare CBS 342.82 TaxID=1314786 RepID=A0A6J3MEA8_9PEZI|nr:uncharacterized protein K489DRAFT_109686 [Dissoconium aciculare CBS 342.82]KAF1826213.1 hypothetical protein K489DRAFT_109686 [Dissoconium aciculare CBS 342.82]
MLVTHEPQPLMAHFQHACDAPMQSEPFQQKRQPGPNIFDALPIEIRQDIARRLESDDDLKAFRLVCRSLHDAVEADGCSFWRYRFLESFDKPLGLFNNLYCKASYQQRKRWLYDPPKFELGRSRQEQVCLGVIRNLINESWSSDQAHPRDHSPNIKHLETFALKASTILKNIFAPNQNKTKRPSHSDAAKGRTRLLATVQVVFAPLILDLRTPDPQAFDFPQSQQAAYSGPRQWSIFHGRDGHVVDMPWVLHQINFWKYHMIRSEECTLYPAFKGLDKHDTPQMWNCPISPDPIQSSSDMHFGRIWKTCFAFIDQGHLAELRAGPSDDALRQDEFEYESTQDAFPEWELSMNQKGNDTWPKEFEDCLHSLTPLKGSPRNVTRSQDRSVDNSQTLAFPPQRITCRELFGEEEDGDDAEVFHADGYLTALPPQSGIPGFIRVTMMKYKLEAGGTFREHWAYEGVMLPGRQMIIGRWWQPFVPEAAADSGPFIMWCVDGQKRHLDPRTDQEEAV